jgi:RHS repeat-associated protein
MARVWSGFAQTVDEVTFWGANGQKLTTYNLSIYATTQLVARATGSNYYFGGKLIKNSTGYVTPDRLGSIGKYFPYGVERPSATTDGTDKFATYFRDSETGLDYANNRYHQPGMGRFMSADPYKASGGTSDPGSWNRYAYTRGDPVNRADPGGLEDCSPDADFCTTGTAVADGADYGTDTGNDICLIPYGVFAVYTYQLAELSDYYFNLCDGRLGDSGGGLQVAGVGPQSNQRPVDQDRNLLLSIQSMLDNALSHSDCTSIFGTPSLISKTVFGSPSAAQVLDGLIQGGQYGSIQFTPNPLYLGSDAETQSNHRWGTFFGFPSSSTVTIFSGTDLSSTAFNTSTYNAAETVLHELGHVLFNMGWSSTITPDGPQTSAANTDKIKAACGKYLQ